MTAPFDKWTPTESIDEFENVNDPLNGMNSGTKDGEVSFAS
jgi:hypothetical protein